MKVLRLNTELEDKLDLEKELQSQKEKSIAQSQLASVGEMAAGVAHEINNPLTIIAGKFAVLKSLLKRENFENEKAYQHIQTGLDTVDRIAKIVNGLKAFSQDGSKTEREEVFIHEVINDVLNLSSERIRVKDIDLKVNEENIGTSTICNKVQLSQVLLNIINNAIHAVEERDDRWINIETKEENKKIKITITDSGSGIPEEIKDKIMHPFFTTKEVGKGTGLGLSVSKGIIEDHQGKLYIDDQSPHTTFIVELPQITLSGILKS